MTYEKVRDHWCLYNIWYIDLYKKRAASLPLSLHMRWPVMRPEGFEFRKSHFHPPFRPRRLTIPTYKAKSYAPASVYAERINTGYGLERATLGIAVWNTENTAKNVTWLEEWPAWIKVYMHTMRVTVNGRQVPNGRFFLYYIIKVSNCRMMQQLTVSFR